MLSGEKEEEKSDEQNSPFVRGPYLGRYEI
jgi:hypothetical protein